MARTPSTAGPSPGRGDSRRTGGAAAVPAGRRSPLGPVGHNVGGVPPAAAGGLRTAPGVRTPAIHGAGNGAASGSGPIGPRGRTATAAAGRTETRRRIGHGRWRCAARPTTGRTCPRSGCGGDGAPSDGRVDHDDRLGPPEARPAVIRATPPVAAAREPEARGRSPHGATRRASRRPTGPGPGRRASGACARRTRAAAPPPRPGRRGPADGTGRPPGRGLGRRRAGPGPVTARRTPHAGRRRR